MDILLTRRLTLRPPLAPDAEAIALWLSDFEVARWLTRVPHPYATADAESWIASLAGRPRDRVFTLHRERLIGVVSLEYRNDGEEPELGYWLARPCWGRGLMREAATAVLAHAFARGAGAPPEAVRSGALTGNAASLAIQDRLGFSQTGMAEAHSTPLGRTVRTLTTRLTRAAFEARTGGHAYSLAA
ncbi:MAG TPA: GNAT family N-acetyltransferase [Rhizobiaceae bacterium]|nr:GNAT family N-acetyltransferase [Rhizobiaceae bacterium]